MTLHAGTVLLSHMAWSLLMVSPLPFLNVSLAKNTYYQLKNKGLDIRLDQIKANQCCTWTRWCRAAGEKIKTATRSHFLSCKSKGFYNVFLNIMLTKMSFYYSMFHRQCIFFYVDVACSCRKF